jgi:serine protease AprX
MQFHSVGQVKVSRYWLFVLGVICLVILETASSAYAQTPEPKGETQHWLLWLRDKGTHATQSLQQPTNLMSASALEMRWRTRTPIDQLDLPIAPEYLQTIEGAGYRILRYSRWLNVVLVSKNPSRPAYLAEPTCIAKYQRIAISDDYLATVGGNNLTRYQPRIGSGSNAVNYPTTADYGDARDQLEQIKVDSLHRRGLRGEGQRILCLDSGFPGVNTLGAFDSLRNQKRIDSTYDFVNNVVGVYSGDSHGMQTSSVISAELPTRFWGVAPRARFLFARTENAITETISEEMNWVMGAEWGAREGANVIQSSVSYSTFTNPAENHTFAELDGRTTIITRGAQAAASRGLVVVNSAGNEGGSSWGKICAPCDADSILCVGATDNNGNATSSSSRGPSADGRVKPDVAALGQGTYYINTSGNPSAGSGTSYSAPMVSGLVTLLRQAHPQAKVMQVVNAIRQSGSHYTTPDSLTGYGVPNAIEADRILRTSTAVSPAQSRTLGEMKATILPDGQLQVGIVGNNIFNYRLELLSLTGRVVGQWYDLPTNVLLPLGQQPLSSGVYILRAITPVGGIVGRVLVP